jgi:hypothetical protein
MPYRYYFDEDHLREWLTRSKTHEGTHEYFQEYIFGVDDFDGYLNKIGGLKKLQSLKLVEQLRA